jgi:glycosyltransferase involved in cell wall biosynthesis
MNPVVSIITPTKDRLALLCHTMDTVSGQGFAAWEHIVVDDGSTDGTLEEVTRRAAADPRVRLIRRAGKKAGANVCRNLGIGAAKGEFAILLDSDDLLRPGCLESRVGLMQRNADLAFAVYPAGVFMETPGDLKRLFHPLTTGDDLVRFLSHECVWEITGPIWRRDYLARIGGFNESLRSMQDMELHVRAICAGGPYIFVPQVDHDIAWRRDFSRISVRYIYEPDVMQAAVMVRSLMYDAVTGAELMTWSRLRALVGLCFEAAEFLALAKRLDLARQVWNSECRHYRAPYHVRFFGNLMLVLARLAGRSEGICARIVNKWKGWVRFRQEPALLKVGNKVGL